METLKFEMIQDCHVYYILIPIAMICHHSEIDHKNYHFHWCWIIITIICIQDQDEGRWMHKATLVIRDGWRRNELILDSELGKYLFPLRPRRNQTTRSTSNLLFSLQSESERITRNQRWLEKNLDSKLQPW